MEGPAVENDGNAAEACRHCCCTPCCCEGTNHFEAFYFEDEAAYEAWLFDHLFDDEAD